MLGEDEKMIREKNCEFFQIATEHIGKKLFPGTGETDCRRNNFRLTSLYKILNGLIAVPVSDLLTPAD